MDADPRTAEFLVIVARDQPELYEQVRRQFADDPAAVLILDRRQGERRRRSLSRIPERRRGPRRQVRPGQEVPADAPIAVRRRVLPAPPGSPGVGKPLTAADNRPPERTVPAEDIAALRTLLTAIDALLAAARPLGPLLRQLRQRRSVG
jgi:hypothetical protein